MIPGNIQIIGRYSEGKGLVISIRGSVPQFDPEVTLYYQIMDVESNSDGQSTSYVKTQAHTCIHSLIVVKMINQVHVRGWNPTISQWK